MCPGARARLALLLLGVPPLLAAPAEAEDGSVAQGTQSLDGGVADAGPPPAPDGSNSTQSRHDNPPAVDAGVAPAAPPSRSAPSYQSTVAGRRPISKDATQSATQVDGDRLRESARPSVFEALSQEAGDVYVSGRGGIHGVGNGATGAIHIRGLGGSPNTQVLVVEDGVPDYQGIFGHPIPDTYVPSLIDSVLIVKGGDSVLYGTNALAGAIILRSRWLERDGVRLDNDAAYGSFSTIRESAAALLRRGRWDLAAAFTGFKTDGHREGAGGADEVGQLAVRLRLTPELRLSLRERVVHLDGRDPGPASHPFADHFYDVWRNAASLGLDFTRGIARLSITPYLNVGVTRLYDGFLAHDYVGGVIAESTLRLHHTTELLVGASADWVDGDVLNRVTGAATPVASRADYAAYGQVSARPVPMLLIVGGGRALYNTAAGFVPLGKAGVRWDIYRGLYAHTRIARNFRQPTIRELYLPFPTANPDLKPEYALNWDVGLGYDSPHFAISASGYRTAADNLIKYFGVFPSAEVVNIDHIVIWGIEGSAALKHLGPLSLFVTGGWQDVGRFTRQNPSAKLNFTIDVSHAFGDHFVGGSLTGEWVHGLYMADYSLQPIDDVFVMDLALRYRYTSPVRRISVEPYLLLRNLLDSRYAYVADYPMPGFNLLGGLRLGI